MNTESLHKALANIDTIIDVRSPSEWLADHIPGAINLPVLSDAEREEIGTLYATSPFEAKKKGAALVARNISAHLEGPLKDKPKHWQALLYCWRGGNRSNSMATVMQKIGWRVEVLEGGYVAFRRFIMRDLERLVASFQYRVICGVTGSGKSLYLRGLASQGEQVLDLEALAHHRGSLLGSEPTGEQPSQKAFETRLWNCLRKFDCARPVYVESESKKIGNVQIPQALMDRMRASGCIELTPPIESRVEFLCQEYAHFFKQPEQLKEKLARLAPLVGNDFVNQCNRLIDAQHWHALVEHLLVGHYDPTYLRSMKKNYAQYHTAKIVTQHPTTFGEPPATLAVA